MNNVIAFKLSEIDRAMLNTLSKRLKTKNISETVRTIIRQTYTATAETKLSKGIEVGKPYLFKGLK